MTDSAITSPAAPRGALPAFDELPLRRVGHAFASGLVMVSAPAEAAAESIRELRTHLVANHANLGRRALAVCGASMGVGCSFVAANLAVSLSQIGIKTLLIDGNLRAPSLQSIFVPSVSGSGLAQVLSGTRPYFYSAIHTDVLPDLCLMYAGGEAHNAQELLTSEQFNSLMDFCLREFEMTIIDTPPANSCADARRISHVTGYSLIVARKNESFVDDVKTLVAQLEADRVTVVGTVLNWN
jgi:capsular exopolysaccharide synthesis family protein